MIIKVLLIIVWIGLFNPTLFREHSLDNRNPFAYFKPIGLLKPYSYIIKRDMIKIGTSGFSFPDWKGTVYPPGLPEREMLPFYEKDLGFHALEVNFTYYTLPSQKSFEAMSKDIERI
jgi:hypothetical protein